MKGDSSPIPIADFYILKEILTHYYAWNRTRMIHRSGNYVAGIIETHKKIIPEFNKFN